VLLFAEPREDRNRYSENLLTTAEAAAVVASVETDFEYPGDRLANAWRTTLFHQFHDILPGAGIPETYDYAAGEYQDVEAAGAMARDRALDALAAGFDCYHEDAPADAYDGQGSTVSRVQPHWSPGNWHYRDRGVRLPRRVGPLQHCRRRRRREHVSCGGHAYARRCVSEGGLAGILPGTLAAHSRRDVRSGLCESRVHSPGRSRVRIRIYRLTEDADATQDGVSVAYDGDTATLENDHYRVDIDGSAGAVASLYDKDIDREFVPDDEVFGGLTIETEAPHGMSAWIRGQVVETEDPELRVARRGDRGWSGPRCDPLYALVP